MENKYDLTKSMADSLTKESISVAAEIGEAAIDTLIESDFAKNIPIIGAAISFLKIGKSVVDTIYLHKLFNFVIAVQNKCANDEDKEKYISGINGKNHNKVIEYLLIILNKIRDGENAKNLAFIFVSYINGDIFFEELKMFSILIENLLPGDIEFLKKHYHYSTTDSFPEDHMLRFVANGIMFEKVGKKYEPIINSTGIPHFVDDVHSKEYQLTRFGYKFLNIFKD